METKSDRQNGRDLIDKNRKFTVTLSEDTCRRCRALAHHRPKNLWWRTFQENVAPLLDSKTSRRTAAVTLPFKNVKRISTSK